MKVLEFKGLWTTDGWLQPAFVALDAQGKLEDFSNYKPQGPCESYNGYFIPGFQNAHSHAFQYAMAGLAEHIDASNERDDFWSWRESMYQLALAANPETIRAIAAYAYGSMLKRGITAVAEFHYLHHDQDGRRYANPHELSEALCEAAHEAGIKLALIPVYYKNGAFDQPALARQRRFIWRDTDEYLGFVQSLANKVGKRYPDFVVGSGVHSLRAAGEAEIKALFAERFAAKPWHIHVAEQTREVEDCLRTWGLRPVEWLLRHLELDENCHLVHATHINQQEIDGLCERKANVVICPSTEGNLGDGLFPLAPYIKGRGRWAIGTDSHIGLSPQEELRWLDYGQRLFHRQRNILCQPGEESGNRAFYTAFQQGQLAIGGGSNFPNTGESFDGLLIKGEHPLIATRKAEKILSTFIYAGDENMIDSVMRQGKWIVKNGQHQDEGKFAKDFIKASQELFGGLEKN